MKNFLSLFLSVVCLLPVQPIFAQSKADQLDLSDEVNEYVIEILKTKKEISQKQKVISEIKQLIDESNGETWIPTVKIASIFSGIVTWGLVNDYDNRQFLNPYLTAVYDLDRESWDIHTEIGDLGYELEKIENDLNLPPAEKKAKIAKINKEIEKLQKALTKKINIINGYVDGVGKKAIRFRKGMLITAGVFASLAVAGVTYIVFNDVEVNELERSLSNQEVLLEALEYKLEKKVLGADPY